MKCAYLLSLFTTPKMTLLPLDKGRRVMKSVEISYHTSLGIGRVCKRPGLAASSNIKFGSLTKIYDKPSNIQTHASPVKDCL